MSRAALHVYLNDHLGGAAAALDLLERLTDRTRGEPEAQALFSWLTREIAADRDTLEETLRRAGGLPDPLRLAGGWIGEKVTRLKLLLDDPADSGLRRLESLEVLALGILGKRSLWRSLAASGEAVPELRGIDLARLEQRAEEQFARAENARLDAARQALRSEPAS